MAILVSMPWGEKRYVESEDQIETAAIEFLLYESLLVRLFYESWHCQIDKKDETWIN
jgi:hypothetical protein